MSSSIRFKYAAITWVFTLLIGFTVAYYLAFHIRSLTWQIALFLLCTIPFLDVEHHPHDFVDPVLGSQRDCKFDVDVDGA